MTSPRHKARGLNVSHWRRVPPVTVATWCTGAKLCTRSTRAKGRLSWCGCELSVRGCDNLPDVAPQLHRPRRPNGSWAVLRSSLSRGNASQRARVPRLKLLLSRGWNGCIRLGRPRLFHMYGARSMLGRCSSAVCCRLARDTMCGGSCSATSVVTCERYCRSHARCMQMDRNAVRISFFFLVLRTSNRSYIQIFT